MRKGAAGTPVAAVVLNWHDTTRTLKCIDSLLKTETLSKILVVDNEADGELRQKLTQFDQEICQLTEVPENRGFAGGVNVALASLCVQDYPYVLVINNDAVVPDGAMVSALCEILDSSPSIGLVAPSVVNPDGTNQNLGGVIAKWSGRATERTEAGSFDYVSWVAVMLRGTTLRDVGLLDESFFMYWEDVDYAIRLRQHGWQSTILTSHHVVHELSASRERAGDKLRMYYAWGLVVLMRKYRGDWRRGAAIRLLAVIAKRAVHGDIKGMEALLNGVKMGAMHAGIAWEAIRESHEARTQTPFGSRDPD